MTLTQFENGYWYATELRSFAKALGVARIAGLRKDELEREIRARLRGGTPRSVARRRGTLTLNGKSRDTGLGLQLDQRIVNYINNRDTKAFLEREATKLSPGIRRRSGARYRLNRWREAQIEAGHAITYRDLVAEYVRLCESSVRFARIPSGRYINFMSDFFSNERSSTHAAARSAWARLKTMDCPKTYDAWKKSSAATPRARRPQGPRASRATTEESSR